VLRLVPAYVRPSSTLMTGSSKGRRVRGQRNDDPGLSTPVHHDPSSARGGSAGASAAVLVSWREKTDNVRKG